MRAAILSALTLAIPALSQVPNTNTDVLAAAHAFDDAQLRGDRAALERMLAPEFLFVRGTGRVGDRRDFIEGFTAPGHTLEPFTITDPLFLRVGNDTAIVGGEAVLKGSADGKPFTQHFRYSDIFVKRAGRWKAVYTQVTALP